MNNREKGTLGEQAACAYLKKQGYKILETNYHASRLAEVDIIAKEKKILVFIEVKLRTGTGFGRGREAVTPKKQESLRTAALHYLACKGLPEGLCRFDVIELSLFGQTADIEHIKNAF